MIFGNKKGKEELELLVKTKTLKKGDVLYNQGDKDSNLFILKKGRCGVYVDDEFITEINEKDSIIGESAALFKQPRSATIKALENCELYVIPADYIDKVIIENPDIGLNLLKIIVKRLHNTSKLAAKLQKMILNYKNEIARLKGEKESDTKYQIGRLLYETGIITKEQLEEVLKL